MNQRLSGIDAIRTAAIALVMLHHYQPAGYWATRPAWMNAGALGVPIFFACSGFLITHTTARKEDLFKLDVREFYVRRFSRITPLLVGAIAVSILATIYLEPSLAKGYAFSPPDPSSVWFAPVWNWWLIFTKIKDPGDRLGVQWGLFWSLTCEIQFYILYPFLLWLSGSTKNLRLALVATIFISLLFNVISAVTGQTSVYFFLCNSFTAFSAIALGCILATIPSRKHSWVATITGTCLSTVVLGLADCSIPAWAIAAPFLIALSSTVLIYGLTGLNASLPSFVCLPGKLCYGLYLWHIPAFYFTEARFSGVAYVVLSLLMAIASFHLLEKPSEQWLRVKYDQWQRQKFHRRF